MAQKVQLARDNLFDKIVAAQNGFLLFTRR